MAAIQKIDFNPNLFNDLYWELEADLNNDSIRYIWLYGGSSASKTFTFCQADLIRKLRFTDDNTMVVRKFGVDIRDSIYADYVGIINDWGLQDYFVCQINYIKCLVTGSYIRFRGLDDSEKIKGLARFKRVVYEEISQGEHIDLKQIRKRLRGKAGQQIIGIFNPISEEHWIKKEVFDKEDLITVSTDRNIALKQQSVSGNVVVYKVTYLNNYFIVGKWVDKFGNPVIFRNGFFPTENMKMIYGFVDKHTIEDFEKDRLTDYSNYEVYALGEWGNIRKGGEFYKRFTKDNQVGRNIYDPALALHISWDDNVNPYLPCGIFQIEGLHLKMIDEIAGETPNNTVKAVCNEIIRKYPAHNSGMFVYGDATANKQDTKLEKGHNFYTLILEYLKEYKPVNRVTRSNPSVVMRGNWINTIFETGLGGIKVTIDEKCTKAISDFIMLKEAPDGTKLKETAKDPKTGANYQKVGHFSDLFDYIMVSAFNTQYLAYINKPVSNVNWSGFI